MPKNYDGWCIQMANGEKLPATFKITRRECLAYITDVWQFSWPWIRRHLGSSCVKVRLTAVEATT